MFLTDSLEKSTLTLELLDCWFVSFYFFGVLFTESLELDDIVLDAGVGWFGVVVVGRNMAESRALPVEASFAVP